MPSSRTQASDRATHYKARRCLLCHSGDIELVLPLARSAIGNDYLAECRVQDAYSLNLHLCKACGNVQIEDVVNPDLLFRQYTYATKSSLGLVEHFRKYAEEMVASTHTTPGSLVVDVGSNDGSLLQAFRDLGFCVVGVDPATEIAERASAEGVPTLVEYFSPRVASQIREDHGPAALVTANNVFAHSDQLPAMADAVRALLAPGGLFVFEVSYLLDIVHKMLFDTIYHEHLCYHSARSLSRFFPRHGLQLIDVKRIPTKGGSLRGTVQLAGGPRSVTSEVRRLIEWEDLTRLHSAETFRAFSRRIEMAKEEFIAPIDRCRSSGRIIAGYGASPTVTTLINQFDLAQRLDFLVDDNPSKQRTFSPGHHVPVYPGEEIYNREADVIAVLAWNFATPIVSRHRRFIESGGQFIVPLPTLQVV
jgi:SAM-dependent methyltransferase